MDENTTRELVEGALGKIRALKSTRDRIASRRGGSIGNDDAIVDMLDKVVSSADGLMEMAFHTKRELTSMYSRDGQTVSKLGSLVGMLGACKVNGAQTIANGAAPITASAVKTAANLVGASQNASSSALDAMQSATNVVKGSIDSSSQKSAQIVQAQIANAASTMTRAAQNAIGKAYAHDQTAAASKVAGVLGQVEQMIETSNQASSQMSQAASIASGAIGQAMDAASQMGTSVTSSIASMVQTVGNTAADMVGSAMSSQLMQGFPQKVGSVVAGTPLGGDSLFGSAFNAAASGVKTAIGAVNDIVGGLAGVVGQPNGGGLAGLANSLMGSAANIAGSIADAGMGVVGSLLGGAADVGSSLMSGVGGVVGSMMDTAKSVGGGIMDAIGGAAQSIADVVSGGGGIGSVMDAASSIADFAGGVLEGGMGLAGNVLGAASDIASGVIGSVGDMAGSIVDGVAGVVDGLVGGAMDAASGVLGAVADGLGGMLDAALGMDSEYDQNNFKNPNEDPPPTDENWQGEGDDNQPGEGNPDDSSQQNSQQEGGSSQQTSEQGKPNTQRTEDEATTTPMGDVNSVQPLTGLIPSYDKDKKTLGWKSFKVEIPSGMLAMMHDGDQQLFNPYGPPNAYWTMYSFRPKDAKLTYPQIGITPSSFEAIRSMDAMLDNIPYIVVKEYFFKNTASTMIDFVKKIITFAKETAESAKDNGQTDSAPDEESNDVGGVKKTGNKLLDKVKEAFQDVDMKTAVIDIPYLLYAGLRKKVYGNTYIFPYIVNDSTVINEASNDSEWGNGEGGGGLMEGLKNAISGIANLVGGVAIGLTGSQAKMANLFPAPTWSGAGKDKVSFAFDLMLINDNIVKARNNYMCVNTIIHNNRSIQKAILAFPGALYEVWLPTGQRHLMCTGKFQLYPLGLNRKVPTNFFAGDAKTPGANQQIGSNMGDQAKLQNPEGKGHDENWEVIPDGYKLSITFTSCLANNMNTAVFQYYVKMTGFDAQDGVPEGEPGSESKDDASEQALKMIKGLKTADPEPANPGAAAGKQDPNAKSARPLLSYARIAQDVDGAIEKFDESTYNKKLEKFRSDIGDQSPTSPSVVSTIRQARRVIDSSNRFLGRLYGAKDGKMWYRPDTDEEIYTTLKPDYRQLLRKKYGQGLKSIQKVDAQLLSAKMELSRIDSTLSNTTSLSDREPLLARKVEIARRISNAQRRKDDLTDELLQLDTDLIRVAFDEQDSVVSVKKRDVTFRVFQQVWNERIMNPYEQDKIQYMTSAERERYFKEKVRELRKFDEHGVLNHPDWFFRIVVLDRIVAEMQRLVLWFKNCSWDDFETVYRITRKLNLLLLDVDSVRSQDGFDINRTNLFHISDDQAKEFTKLDGMLIGNTLYQLFQNQARLNFVDKEKKVAASSSAKVATLSPSERADVDKDRRLEEDAQAQRRVRQDVVARFWGSESNLTKVAYGMVNSDPDTNSLKNEIIALKLVANRSAEQDRELSEKLGQFSNAIAVVKEGLVIKKMNEMRTMAKQMLKDKSDDVNADVLN